jgi:hypothetical protein
MIELVAPDDALELPDEPDEVERELAQTRRRLAEATSAAPDLSLTFGDRRKHGTFDVQFVKEIDYRTREKLLKAWRKKYPHTTSTESSFAVGGKEYSLGNLSGLPGFRTEKRAAEYNAGVDKIFERYAAFVRSWHTMVNEYRRILPFKLVLENAGTAPATDIDVQLWTDAPGVWMPRDRSRRAFRRCASRGTLWPPSRACRTWTRSPTCGLRSSGTRRGRIFQGRKAISGCSTRSTA